MKSSSGIHLGNLPDTDWNSAVLARIDGGRGGIWPKAVVLLSDQLYNLTRQNCRIRTDASYTTTGRPVILDYLQRASSQGVRIIIRIHPSPGNFDDAYRLQVGPVSPFNYCNWNNHRPADDVADEITAIHNYNVAHGIAEWGFEPANEPNIEWYKYNQPVQPDNPVAWQDMSTYFTAVYNSVLAHGSIRVLTPPMAQAVFAENNFTDANAINHPDPLQWCGQMRLTDGTTGYGKMYTYLNFSNDGIDWHNYWRIGFELSGSCSVGAQHVSFFFPDWMKTMLQSGAKPGTITEADLFSNGPNAPQDPNQPLQVKDNGDGWLAANSLRKFITNEFRTPGSAVVAWLLTDDVNNPGQDHNWHEAYNDQRGYAEHAWFRQWWPSFEHWTPPVYLPLTQNN